MMCACLCIEIPTYYVVYLLFFPPLFFSCCLLHDYRREILVSCQFSCYSVYSVDTFFVCFLYLLLFAVIIIATVTTATAVITVYRWVLWMFRIKRFYTTMVVEIFRLRHNKCMMRDKFNSCIGILLLVFVCIFLNGLNKFNP